MPLTVVVRNTGEFQVFLDRGTTAVALSALWTSEATSFSLLLDIVQAGLAEVVAAQEQLGVAVHFQAHWAGEVLLQHPGLLQLAEVHFVVHTVSLKTIKEEPQRNICAEVQPTQTPATKQQQKNPIILIITVEKCGTMRCIGRLKKQKTF